MTAWTRKELLLEAHVVKGLQAAEDQLFAELFWTCFFTLFYNCDRWVSSHNFYTPPLLWQQIKNPGQIVPLYVMEVGRDYPGLAGLFMSGVLSAALR